MVPDRGADGLAGRLDLPVEAAHVGQQLAGDAFALDVDHRDRAAPTQQSGSPGGRELSGGPAGGQVGQQHMQAAQDAGAFGDQVVTAVAEQAKHYGVVRPFLGAQGRVVFEVNRPDRQARRRRGKSDPVDAEAAARAVLAGQATAIPKRGDQLVEMVRCLRVARATAVKSRSQAADALRALLVTAPTELREQLRGLPADRLARAAARLRLGRS